MKVLQQRKLFKFLQKRKLVECEVNLLDDNGAIFDGLFEDLKTVYQDVDLSLFDLRSCAGFYQRSFQTTIEKNAAAFVDLFFAEFD